MDALFVTVRLSTTSFRRPMDHTFQRTLLMPPPTTLLGVAAAALGLSDRELWDESSRLRSIRVAVLARNDPGRTRDLWTVMKIKQGQITERSPYFRELLFEAFYTLIYGGPEDMLRTLYKAFQDPVYALSLGREDELLWIEDLALEPLVPSESEPLHFEAPLSLGTSASVRLVSRSPRAFALTPPSLKFSPWHLS